MKQPGIKWFARGGNIAVCGPFDSQEAASAALITTSGVPIDGAFVWPETHEATMRRGSLRGVALDNMRAMFGVDTKELVRQ